MKRIIVTVSCIALLMVGVSGCGKKAEEKMADKMVEKVLEKQLDGHASVNISEGKMNISTKEGDLNIVTGEGAKKVAFPEDLYKYEGAKIIVSATTPGGQHFGLESEDDAKKIYDTSKAKMESMGWKTRMTVEDNGEGMLMMEKDGKNVQIAIGRDKQKTTISILLAEKH